MGHVSKSIATSIVKNVFIWDDYKAWRKTILRLLDDRIDRGVLARVKENPRGHFVGDDLSWIDEAITKAKCIVGTGIQSVLTGRLRQHYQFLRAFHGCRTESVESYRQFGLLPSDLASLDAIALQTFSNKERVNEAMQEMSRLNRDYKIHNQGKVFFCFQKRFLVEHCHHYLNYGSEYLLCIARRIGESEALQRRGRATVVECNVPMCDVSDGFLKYVAGQILREIFERYCDSAYQPGFMQGGFSIDVPLKPENIVGFDFPSDIPQFP